MLDRKDCVCDTVGMGFSIRNSHKIIYEWQIREVGTDMIERL